MPAEEPPTGVRSARPSPSPPRSTSPMGALLASCAAARAVSAPPAEESPLAGPTDRAPSAIPSE